MSTTSKPESLEGTVLAGLAIVLVLCVVVGVYLLISSSPSNDVSMFELNSDKISKLEWTVFGIFFFLYGTVGVLREKIGVGFGSSVNRVSTILEGTPAFTAGAGTAIGGVLMLITAGIHFYPSLSAYLNPFATLISGFAAILLSWICGSIIRALGY